MVTSVISEDNLARFHKGENFESYRSLGAHIVCENNTNGVRFALWAPNAREVSIVGDFNNWNGTASRMERAVDGEVWTKFIAGIGEGFIYKYEITTSSGNRLIKSDPFGFYSEKRPANASKVFNLEGYKWNDEEYVRNRNIGRIYERPVNIYEVHLGSWRRNNGEFRSYLELAEELVDYAREMGYTHIELMPVMEHPFDGSWGYQATGYYSVTSRYGNPRDLMYFIDKCHTAGLGVIMDWVPGHFCKDDHGLRLFDGTPLFEYENSNRSENYGWGTLNFDHGKPEVRSFLISNAFFYFDIFHVDGIRVDAVAAMLYLNYGKKDGEWVPNIHGGYENLEAIGFMKRLNEVIFEHFPNALMIAEESTAWPLVTKPVYSGGLGCNYKWNMGWMNDILKYTNMETVLRERHSDLLTFSFMYTLSENYILPLSHDEVVHGKKSLLDKMSGDYWQKFAGLRTLYAYMTAHPGKKLLFMGGEFGQFIEWNHEKELDWMLLEYDMHKFLKAYVKRLNYFYSSERALFEMDHEPSGFEVTAAEIAKGIIVIKRFARNRDDFIIAVFNFMPEVHQDYRIGIPREGEYFEVLNSDQVEFGGTGIVNRGNIFSKAISVHNQAYSIEIKIPPLGAAYFKCVNVKKDLGGEFNEK